MVGGRPATTDLDVWFQNLMVTSGRGKTDGAGVVLMGWKDLPMELLMWILSLVDDRMVIVASGVCTGWRDAIWAGTTHLSLSWSSQMVPLMDPSPSTTRWNYTNTRLCSANPAQQFISSHGKKGIPPSIPREKKGSAPYQAVTVKAEESQQWLGLAPQTFKPSLASKCSR